MYAEENVSGTSFAFWVDHFRELFLLFWVKIVLLGLETVLWRFFNSADMKLNAKQGSACEENNVIARRRSSLLLGHTSFIRF